MSVYRVLVSFTLVMYGTLRPGDVVELPDAEHLVRAGYLKQIEEVSYVDGTVAGPGDAVPDDVPEPRRRGRKAEVTGEPDSSVSDAGPPGSEE